MDTSKLTLFHFIKEYLFGNKKKWNQLLDSDKKKHYFMSLRIISIRYPQIAAGLSLIKINQAKAMDYLHHKIFMHHKGVAPKWIYESGKKKQKKQKIDGHYLNLYLKVNHYNDKDLEFMKKYFYDELCEEVKLLKKSFNTEEKNKKK